MIRVTDAEETVKRNRTCEHPCYSKDAHHKYARMHLPVAPRCNIGCNYCNRKYDCVNESRPGVTSEVLTPQEAKDKFARVKEKITNLSVVGIAGPGDALANWEETKESIALIKELDPDVMICLSTNGLRLPELAAEIVKMGVRHVTVTVNCLEAEIGARIYRFVNYQGQNYSGLEGSKILIRNQLAGIEYLARHQVMVKVNIVMIKDINDWHIPAVVKKVKELGAFISNIMPLIPAPGSVYETFPQTSMKELEKMRDKCQIDLQQMRHCKQCRADAIGLLEEDRAQEFAKHSLARAMPVATTAEKRPLYQIAVTSKYGKLVDLHFGHAGEFLIYQTDGKFIRLMESRPVEKYCRGMAECDAEESKRQAVIDAIGDCDAVLTMRIGEQAQQKLRGKGLLSVEACYTVEDGLRCAVERLRQGKTESA